MIPSFLQTFAVGLVTAAACVLGCVPLRADEPAAGKIPLGATPTQVVALYGPVLRHNARVRRHAILEGGTVIDGDLYGHDGLVIRVVFHGGAAVLLEYTRVGGPLTGHDVTLLLAANADVTSIWEPGKDNTETNRYYRRSDGKAVAHYATEFDGSLLVAADNVGSDFYGDKLLGR